MRNDNGVSDKVVRAQEAPGQQTNTGNQEWNPLQPDPPKAAEQPIPQPEPTQQANPEPLQPLKMPGGKKKLKKLPVIIAIVVVIAMAAALFYISTRPSSSTTTITTTVAQVHLSQINSCRVINTSGKYYVEGAVHTSIQAGSCIDVQASNVSIICNKNSITGSGPYVLTPPHTYGIMVANQSNVSIQGCVIGNFSYGVYASFSSRVSVTASNISQNYLSNIWLQNSTAATIANNYLSSSPSRYGSLSIAGNSTNNTVQNNTLKFNAQVGISVNSTGNRFINNSVTSTPLSFFCSPGVGFKPQNYASGNLCYNSTGCSFLQCKGSNVQSNTREVKLNSTISSCGAIKSPGRYYMYGNIDMQRFVNTSESTLPCINILANNVTLDCNNYYIINATTGIDIPAVSGTRITNCNVRDSETGISIESVSKANLTNVGLYNNAVSGISATGSSGLYMQNVTASGNEYGVSFSNVQGSTMYQFSLKNNTYGLYLAGSTQNAFSNGVSNGNAQVDVYATRDSLSSSDNAWQKSTCTSTDADWAPSCHVKISPSLQYYPLQACGPLTRSGQYLLETNLVGIGGNCFTVMQNGTSLNCKNHLLINPTHNGTAISSIGKSGVLIQNCSISGFNTGIKASGQSLVVVNTSITGSNTGINLTASTGSLLLNNSISHSYVFGLLMKNVTKSVVSRNLFSSGLENNTGLYLYNSPLNHVQNNTFSSVEVGLLINGNSTNNTISDNLATGNIYDYACSYQNSGINAELGGVNYGTTKYGCFWIVALLQNQRSPPCTTTTTPTSYFLTNDYIYGYGATCFNIEANSTIINCQGHTIMATSGGTFAEFNNSNGKSVIENCNLIGFTTPIVARNSSISVINNTIYANASISPHTIAVNVSSSSNVDLADNYVVASAYGIMASNVASGKIQGNMVTASNVSYVLDKVQNVLVSGNDALYYSSRIGMLLNNSLRNRLSQNYVSGTSAGLVCNGTSMQANGNTDLGGNMCRGFPGVGNTGCSAWLASSKESCPAT